jgi:putative OPT family oligopeptide transporter
MTDRDDGERASTGAPEFSPYLPDEAALPELTPRALVLGTILGVVFGASSLYLVLKVGLTVSASIPVAVISIALFRLASKLGIRDASLLENNIVQTAGSAGESIAFGVGVTMPAILILGFDLEIWRVMLVAVLGGLLGILMMIPLRRALIVAQHGKLKYPEGTACAEVLKAGASAESRAAASPAARAEEEERGGGRLAAHVIFTGFGIGIAYKTAMVALRAWKDVPERVFGRPFAAASVGVEISPELLGVGYIIGPRIASIMCAGGVLAYLVLIPLIKFFGDAIPGALAPGTIPIREMGPSQIRGAYVLYVGAGAVAAGGIVSLLRSLPLIARGLRAGLRDVSAGQGGGSSLRRTESDLPMRVVLVGALALVLALWAAPPLQLNLVGAVLIVALGFLFVTVSSRLTGEIGSSSNPISGMTVATLLLTCLVFLAVGWTGRSYYVTALSVGAVVCIAASNGGTTSQDLKTGFLVGATPRLQQISILIGAVVSALVLGPILLRLNEAATTYVPAAEVAPAGLSVDPRALPGAREAPPPSVERGARAYLVWHKTDDAGGPPGRYLVDDAGRAVWLVDPGINGVHPRRPDGSEVRKFDAPKATLMSYIIKGILDRRLPWGLVLFGVMIALTLELSGIPSLAFAVGVYLPLASSTPILAGGIVRWLVDRRHRPALVARGLDEAAIAAEADRSPGVLLASGYIAGGAIAGILIAFLAGALEPVDRVLEAWATAHNPFFSGPRADLLALLPFLALAGYLLLVGIRRSPSEARASEGAAG